MKVPARVLWRRGVHGGRCMLALLLGAQAALLAQGPIRAESVGIDPPVLLLHPGRASSAHWQMLPGVGPVLGGRLERELHGRSSVSWTDLDAVPGVGPVALERWRSLVLCSDGH